MSIHDFYITDNNEFIKNGEYLSERNRKYGYNQLKIGRNVIDNVEFKTDKSITVHEFKRGKRPLKGDIMQLSHYMNILELNGYKIDHGELHLLGSKKIEIIKLTDEIMKELNSIYEGIVKLKDTSIPEPKKNYFCVHGCSYRNFCWS